MDEAIFTLAGLIALIVTIIVLVKYFRLCKDVRAIRESIESKEEFSFTPKPVVDNRVTSKKTPTDADVREFQDRVRMHIKANKGADPVFIENIIASYNKQFNVDFHQYLKRPQE